MIVVQTSDRLFLPLHQSLVLFPDPSTVLDCRALVDRGGRGFLWQSSRDFLGNQTLVPSTENLTLADVQYPPRTPCPSPPLET